MNEKTQKLLNALLEYHDIQDNRVLKKGFSISTITDDVLEEPYVKELNIKLRFFDEEELKAYEDEKGTTKEG